MKLEAVLAFIHEEADNEYVPFVTLDKAAERIEEYVNNGDSLDKLDVYIDHDISQDRKNAFWEKVHRIGVKTVWAINQGVYMLASKP